MMPFYLLACIVALGAGNNLTDEDHQSSRDIQYKQVAPSTVVYIENVGPYWSLGPRFAELRDYLDELGKSSPMFVRHLSDPRTVPASQLRTEVGFWVALGFQAKPPYLVANRPGGTVAFIEVKQPFALVSRYYEKMQNQSRKDGYESAGLLTEVYHFSSANRPVKNQKIELRMPVHTATGQEQVLQTTPKSTEIASSIPVETISNAEVNPPAANPKSPDESRKLGTAEEKPIVHEELSYKHGDEKHVHNTLSPTTTSTSEASPAPEHQAGNSPSVSTMTLDEETPELAIEVKPETPTEKLGATEDIQITDDAVSTDPETPDDTEVKGDTDFIALAERMLPIESSIPQEMRVWVGHIVLRIGAAGRGVAKTQPGKSQEVQALASAIEARYQTITSGSSNTQLLADATIRNPKSVTPTSTRMRKITRQLDTLLAEIASSRRDSAEILLELRNIAESTGELLQGPTKPTSAEK